MARPFGRAFFVSLSTILVLLLCYRFNSYTILYKKTVPAEADTADIIEFRITPTCKDYDTRSGALS
jgi:hypothetical protein